MRPSILCALVLSISVADLALAESGDDRVEQILERQEQTIRDLENRIEELESGEPQPSSAVPPVAAAPEAAEEQESDEARSPAEEAEADIFGRNARVRNRHTLNDRQSAAVRISDYTLDPAYRGFIHIPNTVLMVKLNAKARVDFIGDSADPGTDFRLVPARFPPGGKEGWQFSANANGSQLIMDMRAPSLAGSPRLYYQSDFFGSNSDPMRYRLQHLYGEAYGLLAGFTFGIFENPDAWPDTVDYEGPNSVIFARRALLHYMIDLTDELELTLGIEDPDIFIDQTGDPGSSQRSRAPDGGFNIRWTPDDLGHIQISTIFRSIGVKGDTFSDDDTFGWGVNASGSVNLWGEDTMQYWFVYGRGVGGMGNDTSFEDSDAAFNGAGHLKPLEYYSTMVAFTHHWTPRLRSTLTHGYVHLENTSQQAGDAYHESHYASVNAIYQVFKRISVGLEGLYGWAEVKDGRRADVFRVQLGIHFRVFD
jgi:hypothetical protein